MNAAKPEDRSAVGRVTHQDLRVHWLDWGNEPACRPPAAAVITSAGDVATVTCAACKQTTAYLDEVAYLATWCCGACQSASAVTS